MENINKLIKNKLNDIKNSEFNFKSLFDIIYDQPNSIFIEYIKNFKIKTISYDDFKDFVYRFASYIKKSLKEEKGTFIGIYMENSPYFIASLWALLMNGYKPILLNTRMPIDMTLDVLKMVKSNTIIGNVKLSNNIKNISVPTGFDLDENILKEPVLDVFDWADELAIISTATSLNLKICVYKGKNVSKQILYTEQILSDNKGLKEHYKGRLKHLCFLPFYHIFGLFATYFWYSVFGRTFVLLNDYSSKTILNTIRKCEVTHIFAVPLFWNTIAKEVSKALDTKDDKIKTKFNIAKKLNLSLNRLAPNISKSFSKIAFKDIYKNTLGESIKFLITGGSYINDETLSLFNGIGYPLANGYGMTEVGITSVELSHYSKDKIKGSVGKPFRGINYEINDNILQIKSDSMASTIITKDKVINIESDGVYITNDIAVNKNGSYYILGRKDDVFINAGGENINPDLIEKKIFFKTIKFFTIINLNNRLSLIISIDKNLNDLKRLKLIDEVETNINNLLKENIIIDDIYYTFDPLMSENEIKVSRAKIAKLLSLKKIEIHKVSNLKDYNNFNIEEVNKDILNRVIDVISNVLCIDKNTIKPNDHFIFDLGGTSLEYFTLIIELKKTFEINFNFNNENCSTPLDFAKFIINNYK